jgi:hypothetical protein
MLSRAVIEGKSYVLSGWNQRSDWYKNLRRDDRVTIQDDRKTYPARARRVTKLGEFTQVMEAILAGQGDSHFYPWLESLDIQPTMQDMITKHERVFLIALDPCEADGHPAPLAVDLLWVWGLALLPLVAFWYHKHKASTRDR